MMIEFCSKKKMILAIAGLILISVVVLFIESNMSLRHEIKDATLVPGNLSTDCASDDTTIEEECGPCSTFEKKANEFCKPTGYRELIRCQLTDGTSKTSYRSCPKISWMEEYNFMIFEVVTAAVGTVAYLNVAYRQKRLDTLLMEKVHRQIAAGV